MVRLAFRKMAQTTAGRNSFRPGLQSGRSCRAVNAVSSKRSSWKPFWVSPIITYKCVRT